MARLCELVSPLGSTLMFSQMSVSEELSQLFEIGIEAISEKNDLDPKALLGKSMTVRVTYDDGAVRFFNGYVTRMAFGASRGRYFTWHFTLRPWFWFLTRTSDCRIFQEATVPSIIDEVFADEGTASFDKRLAGKYADWEYCVQYRETDFNFVSRLMEQEGIYYYFEHGDGNHKLVLMDSKGRHVAVAGDQTLPFVPPSARQSQPRDHVDAWDASLGIEPSSFALDDYDFKRPSASLDVIRKPELASGFAKSDYEIYDYPGDYDTFDEGEAYGGARAEELHGRSFQYRGSGSLRFFAPGLKFKLSGHPKPDQNGEYVLTGTQMHFSDPSWESGASGEAEFSCSFSAIRSSQQFRPRRSTPRPLINGIQTAEVCGPAGDEIHTDKFGRIKVQFHWDRRGKKDDKTSCWMRVAFLAAGGRFGFVSIPRIGHEAVVSFLEGDPDRPMVTGVVYNGANMPPWELPANKTQSGLLTRSSKGGSQANANAIRFEDKKGEEQVWLHAERNQDIEVENDETHWVGHDRHKTIDHDEVVHVKHDRTELVDNNESITIGVNRSLTVGSNQTENIGVSRSITVGSSHSENIGSAMSIIVGSTLTETVGLNYAETVGGAMEITVGAAMAITVGVAMAETIGGSKTATVGGSSTESVGRDKALTVAKNLTESIGANRQTTVEKDDKTVVQGAQRIEVAKEQSIQAKKVQITADDEISFKTGDAEITMKKNGDITIKGKQITVKGSGDVIIKGSKIAEN